MQVMFVYAEDNDSLNQITLQSNYIFYCQIFIVKYSRVTLEMYICSKVRSRNFSQRRILNLASRENFSITY